MHSEMSAKQKAVTLYVIEGHITTTFAKNRVACNQWWRSKMIAREAPFVRAIL